MGDDKVTKLTEDAKLSTREKIALRNSWLKIVIFTALTVLLVVKIWNADFKSVFANFDFSDLLSLFLAMFSIGLAVLFYLKATDTSNIFYDNTYRFTKDVSEILGRVEAGFGERLKHLDEGYSGLKSAVEKIPFDRTKAEEEIKEEEEQVKKVEQERVKLIDDLAKRARLQEEEKKQLFEKLSQQDEELNSARRELHFLRRKIQMADRSTSDIVNQYPNEMVHFLRMIIKEKMDPELLKNTPVRIINRKFKNLLDDFPSRLITDLKRFSLLDEDMDLTNKGIAVIKELTDYYWPNKAN